MNFTKKSKKFKNFTKYNYLRNVAIFFDKNFQKMEKIDKKMT